MKLGIDFTGKKEYEKLDFFSKSIQDVNWGLIGEIFDGLPDTWAMSIRDFRDSGEFDISGVNPTLSAALKNDPRKKTYGKLLGSLLTKFLHVGHNFEGPQTVGSRIHYGVTIYTVDFLSDKYYLAPNKTPVDGILVAKLPLDGYGEVLKMFNDQFFSSQQYGYRARNDKLAKRMRHIIRAFGGQEHSDSCYTCSRKLTKTLNEKLSVCGEPDSFPIRNLDLYADLVDSIAEYLDNENQISYSKICQYKLKIMARRPIYEVNFL